MGLLRFVLTISGLTLLSRISGLVRDVVIARSFGASPLTDAFWIAFRIPNLLRRLFAEGAFSQAFVPILGELKAQSSLPRTQQVINYTALLLSSLLLLITLFGVIFAPLLTLIIASGLNEPSTQQAAIAMTRIMFPYIFCMSLVSLASGVLNTWSRFAIPALTPLLLNLSMIASSLWLSTYFELPIYALAVGVMIGGILQLITQWIALIRLGLAPKFNTEFRNAAHDPIVRRIAKKMLPAILGVSVAQISILINTNIASWLPAGSVTWLSFADRLMEFPSALLGVALGTVLLPYLSAAHAQQDQQRYNELLDWGLRLIFLLGLPAAVGLALLGNGLSSILFNYGAFTVEDTRQTASAILAYSIGLIGILSIKILAPGFYAKQDIKTPVKIAILILCITQALNLVFVPLFQHAGLALSIGTASLLNACLLYLGLRRRNIYQPQQSWYLFFLKLLPALCVLAVFLFCCQNETVWNIHNQNSWVFALHKDYLSHWVHNPETSFHISRIICVLGLIIGSILCYFATLFLTGFRLKDFKRS